VKTPGTGDEDHHFLDFLLFFEEGPQARLSSSIISATTEPVLWDPKDWNVVLDCEGVKGKGSGSEESESETTLVL